MEIHELKLFDRSRVTTDWDCRRMRYWNYEYEGRGIVESNTSLDLYMGQTIHDAVAAIAGLTRNGEVVNIDEISTMARNQLFKVLTARTDGTEGEINFANEQSSLVEGLVRGFFKLIWPRLIAEYPKILFIEEEMLYPYDGMAFMSKPDLVLSDGSGNVVYFEYKTTRSKSEGWVNGWATAVQLHSTIKAIKASKDVDVERVVIQGLYKGFESYGKQNSPFCYAYYKAGQPPMIPNQTQYVYRQGFKRVPVWEMEGGVKKWVEGMPDEVLSAQFPQPPPIFVDEDMVDTFFRQAKYRENEIELAGGIIRGSDDKEVIQNVLDVAFPQNFSKCKGYYGRDCEYMRICHGKVDDPIRSGWEWREPHHSTEVERFEYLERMKDEERNITEEIG